MALSYGLTNPAAGMISTSTPEPTIIGYKLYANGGTGIVESNDFGLTWNDCTFNSNTGTKYNIGYDSINNKVFLLGDYGPYTGTNTNYSWYATPVLNQTTSFTRGILRNTSYNNDYAQHGALFDATAEVIVSLQEYKYYSPYQYSYMLTPSYSDPNSFTERSFLVYSGATNPSLCIGDNGICIASSGMYKNSNNDDYHKAKVFYFDKNNNYAIATIKDLSTSDLGKISYDYKCAASYLKNVGFVLTFMEGRGSELKCISKTIDFEGNIIATKNWGTFDSTTGVFASSSTNYYSSKIYLAINNKVYYTTDGINWNTCSSSLPGAVSSAALGIYNTDDNIIMQAKTDKTIYVSSNGGSSWSSVTNNMFSYTNRNNKAERLNSYYRFCIVPIYA